MLTTRQEQVLESLVAAARNLDTSEPEMFVFISVDQDPRVHIRHRGLVDQPDRGLWVLPTDLRQMEQERLIIFASRNEFDITANGYRYVDHRGEHQTQGFPGREKRPAAQELYKYDVAISFAGTERTLAEELAKHVTRSHFRVFYDKFYAGDTWGEDLTIYFDRVYRLESRYCVVFASTDYLKRVWTRHELRSAIARTLRERGNAYILPIQVDDIELAGIPPTIGYLSLDSFTLTEI